MNSLLEQAARVLDHQPTRSMEAETLYRRAVRESGVDVPFPRFVTALREQKERFRVIDPDPVAGLGAGWDARQRTLYRAALEAAGVTHPIVVLAERLVEPGEPGTVPVRPATVEDVFGDVHEALTHLLRTTDPEDALYAAALGAVEELHLLRRLTVPDAISRDAE